MRDLRTTRRNLIKSMSMGGVLLSSSPLGFLFPELKIRSNELSEQLDQPACKIDVSSTLTMGIMPNDIESIPFLESAMQYAQSRNLSMIASSVSSFNIDKLTVVPQGDKLPKKTIKKISQIERFVGRKVHQIDFVANGASLDSWQNRATLFIVPTKNGGTACMFGVYRQDANELWCDTLVNEGRGYKPNISARKVDESNTLQVVDDEGNFNLVSPTRMMEKMHPATTSHVGGIKLAKPANVTCSTVCGITTNLTCATTCSWVSIAQIVFFPGVGLVTGFVTSLICGVVCGTVAVFVCNDVCKPG